MLAIKKNRIAVKSYVVKIMLVPNVLAYCEDHTAKIAEGFTVVEKITGS